MDAFHGGRRQHGTQQGAATLFWIAKMGVCLAERFVFHTNFLVHDHSEVKQPKSRKGRR
jgi:hypothetical protein